MNIKAYEVACMSEPVDQTLKFKQERKKKCELLKKRKKRRNKIKKTAHTHTYR